MSMSMPDMSMSMPNGMGGSTNTDTNTDVDTTAPTSMSPSVSPSSVPSSAPSSAPSSSSTLAIDGNVDAVIVSGLEDDSSASNPSRSLTIGQAAVIAIITLAVCAALIIGLLVLRQQTLAVRSSWGSGLISSGSDSASQASVSSLSDGTSQVGDPLA
jgi:hypothetical protein